MLFVDGDWPSHAVPNELLRIHSCFYQYEIGHFACQSSLSITWLVSNRGPGAELVSNITAMRIRLNKPGHSVTKNISAKQGHA